MAKTGSYIKLDRGLKNNSIWLEKPFSKGQAWVDLLLLAQGVDREKQYRGKIQHQKPGEVYTSILYLSNRWGWGRNKVYRFLEYLIKSGMIAIQGRTSDGTINRTQNDTYNGTTNGTIISIENWALYQTQEINDDTNNGTQDGTQKRTRSGTHNRKQYTRESIKEKANREEGRSAPVPPSGIPERGTDEFRLISHLVLKQDEGTLDDIPVQYRSDYKNFSDYWGFRNQ